MSYNKYKIISEVEDRFKARMPKKQKELKNKNIGKNLREMREDMKIKLNGHNNECSVIKCRELEQKSIQRERYTLLEFMKNVSF